MKYEVNYVCYEKGTKNSRWFRLDNLWLADKHPSVDIGHPYACGFINENVMQPMYSKLNQSGYTCYLDSACRCLWVEAPSDSTESVLIMLVGEEYSVTRVPHRGPVVILVPDWDTVEIDNTRC